MIKIPHRAYFIVWSLLYHSGTTLALLIECSATELIPVQGENGHSLLGTEFLLNYTNFNHGSFGSCPKSILEHQSYLRVMQEQQPDTWMRHHYRELVNVTRNEIAEYLDVKFKDLVLVESASTGVNSIMRSLQWRPEGNNTIMYFSVAYGMVKNTAEWLKRQRNESINIVEIPVKFPILNDSSFTIPMWQTLEDMRQQDKLQDLQLVILDHIASQPAVKEPVKKLVEMIRSYAPNCFILVDGAHAMGQVQKLNISEMAPIDAYVTNGHKWLYSPKGSAVLWVNQTVVKSTFPEPTVISSTNLPDTTSLWERFQYVSTRDYTATISMVKALQFRRNFLGEEKLYSYIRCLAITAKSYLMKKWKVDALASDEMEEFMINLKLPLTSNEQGEKLQSWLLNRHNTYMLVLHRNDDNEENRNENNMMGYYYTRLSAQIYLEFSDFVKLGDLILEFMEQYGRKEYE